MATVVIAPDSFKGSIDASAAATAIAIGWTSVRAADSVMLRPMADGGEGTVDAFAAAVAGAQRHPAVVSGPANQLVDASWLSLPDGTAVIELAAASGLHLVDPPLPFDAHTLGFGQLIAAALEAGATRMVLGIGGSASTDGGAGLLTALGARFLDAAGAPVPLGNRGLASVASVDLSALPTPPAGSVVLTDVTNALLGSNGAAAVFGPQKGASAADIDLMDAHLARLVSVLDLQTLAATSGAGAAGGAGFGLLAWGVPLAAGARSVGELIGLPTAVASADLVITGEGRFDAQTASGKVADYVGSLAVAEGVPIALIAGSVEASTEQFADAVSLAELAGSAAASMVDPARWLHKAGATLASRYPSSREIRWRHG